MNVLVVDEHESTTRPLRNAGHDVTVARSGREVRDLSEQRAFDAIVLALQSQDADPLQLCDVLRRDNGAVPIVMLVANDTAGERVRCSEAGADDCLPTACPVDELLARLRALVRRTSLQLETS